MKNRSLNDRLFFYNFIFFSFHVLCASNIAASNVAANSIQGCSMGPPNKKTMPRANGSKSKLQMQTINTFFFMES